MVRILSISLAVLLFFATAGLAAERPFYLELNGGAVLEAGAMDNRSDQGDFNLEFSPGYQGSLALGYRFGAESAIGEGRMELELGYRTQSLDKIEFSDGSFAAEGEAKVLSLMVNAYSEYPGEGPLTPYFGVGIGAANLTLSGVELAGVPVIDDNATIFAYQLAVGLDWPLTRWLTLDLGYRFFGTTEADLTDALGVSVKSKYLAHGLQVGFRF